MEKEIASSQRNNTSTQVTMPQSESQQNHILEPVASAEEGKHNDDVNKIPSYQPQIPINPSGRSRTPNRRGRSRSPTNRRSRSPANRRSRSPGGRRSQSPARIRRLASRQGTPQVVKESSLDVVVEATPRTEAGLRTSRR